jgi:hypothetical protein
MDTDSRLIILYSEAIAFLESKVGKSILQKHLTYYETNTPDSMSEVFRQMVNSLKNKQGYVNFIADTEDMRIILEGFDNYLLIKKFGSDWKKLFYEFQQKFAKKYKMDIDNKRNAWVMYCKGVLSCANFLSNFNSIEDFKDFILSFSKNEFTTASLPMLLEKEIYGYGFPLACDFLKEIGFVQYSKPDVHLKDIFEELHIVNSRSDYEVFKTVAKISLLTKTNPVIVDKVFWLIGSGKFHLSDIKISSPKREFINTFTSKYKIN